MMTGTSTRRSQVLVLMFLHFWASPCCTAQEIVFDGSAESIAQLMAQFWKSMDGTRVHRRAQEMAKNTTKKPNFLLIMTDDQDQLLNSTHPTYMPSLHKLIATKGIQMRSFTCSTSVCCPSRVNFFSGQFTHNHNVTSNLSPQGGYAKFQAQQLDRDGLPVWLQSLGYRTYFTGKFLNGFDPRAKYTRCPSGWTVFESLVKPYVLNYWNTAFTTNCEFNHTVLNQYGTDVLLNKTLHYIQDAAKHPDQPFYIQISPLAPHEGCGENELQADGDACASKPSPATRHADLYKDVRLPMSANYGVPTPDGTLIWNDATAKAKNWNYDRMLELYLARIRSLRAVDEMIGSSVAVLESLGLLDNTYVIFMSDNGFKIGHHGVFKGKLTAYEEDVRVPLFIRGPGITEGVISDYPGTMCDVPATIVDLAGGVIPDTVDGTPIPLKALVASKPKTPGSTAKPAAEPAAPMRLRDQVPHEMWVWGSDTRLTGRAYRALRVCSTYLIFGTPAMYQAAALKRDATFGFRLNGTVPYWDPKQDVIAGDAPVTCYKFVVWCTGTVELYDLMLDPAETINRVSQAPKWFLQRLEAYLVVQGFCRGKQCSQPYSVLHPKDPVYSFDEVMNVKYDALYEALPPFRFLSCQKYFYPENEPSWMAKNVPTAAASSIKV